jgi:O-acetyl-ADP-ribose deacetylase (regulator of RNase III)
MQNRCKGDILTVERGIIVHQVNAQGVMGGGVAKVLKDRYPQMYRDYIDMIGPAYTQRDGGRPYMGLCVWTQVAPDLWIASVVGQQFFGRDKKRYTSYDALDEGFSKISAMAKPFGLDVHYPLIGCGLGGGDWSIVSAIINTRLDTINHTLWELPE